MPHAQLLSMVRERVARALASPPHADAFRESLLIRGGSYCGRRFETDDGYAIWFAEEMQLKIYERGGRVIDVLLVDEGERYMDCSLTHPRPQTQRLAA